MLEIGTYLCQGGYGRFTLAVGHHHNKRPMTATGGGAGRPTDVRSHVWLANAFVASAALVGSVSCQQDSTGTAEAGPVAELEIVSGNKQTAVVGTELADPLLVRVNDGGGIPLPTLDPANVISVGLASVGESLLR